MTGHLLLVDASGFAHRAFHSASPTYRDSDGMPTWAILGFMGLCWRLLGAADADRPTHAAAVFDHPSPTFRHKIYPKYKGQRVRSEELTVQMPYMLQAAVALGLFPLQAEGFEADDIIATVARQAWKQHKIRSTIVSVDKDLAQLVVDDQIEIVDPMARRRYRSADVQAKFGVKPSQIAALLAIAGDSVDNIPGIPGIGMLQAAALLRRFGSAHGIVEARHSREIKASTRVALNRNLKSIPVFLKLTKLRTDVPGLPAISALESNPVMKAKVVALLKELEASSHFETIFKTDPVHRRPVDATADPLGWWREELVAPGQRIPEVPQCGFYRRRLHLQGVLVPARIFREREVGFDGEETGRDLLQCEIGGERRDPVAEWGRLCMQPITRETYEEMLAEKKWVSRYAPDDPVNHPRSAVNLAALPAVRNPKHKGR